MADPLESVNEVARLFHKWANERDERGELRTASLHRDRAAAIEAVVAELKELRRWRRPVPAAYGDLSDLPDELLAQLSGVKTDELEDQIYAAVKAAGEEIELDRLLIELFRRHGDVHERRFLNNKCYRMVQKGLIHQVPGKKGVYTTASQPEPGAPKASHSFSADLDDEIPF
ncbi:MAG TPA: hypothetical protein PLF78_05350 [Caulobacter sp.]|nr:hypothetical protein [Caulobacter sp.]